jgi:TetR/AcrR family transcriptional regulator, repressor of fatR-cypB operon
VWNVHSNHLGETTSAASKKPSESRRDALESRVIDAALELFAERGYHGTSVPAVMERAGIGAGSLYRLFESKEALVNAVFRNAKRRLEVALRDGLRMGGEQRALFDELWARLAAFAEAEPVAFRFLELQDHTPYLDGASRQQEIAVLAPIALGCMDLQRRGVFRQDVGADVIIAFVWGAFVGLVKAARLGYLTLGQAQVDAARDACWRAFSAAPEPAEREKERWKRRR